MRIWQLKLLRARLAVGLALIAILHGCSTSPVTEPVPVSSSHPLAPRSQPEVKPAQPAVDAKSAHCVALAMYWEARGEGRQGMQAVGSVILNRVADPRFPNSPCAVVYQGGETPPCQFSWWCDGKSDTPGNRKLWASARQVAADVLSGNERDNTGGALFFHTVGMKPPWDRQLVARVGNHLFYR